MSGIYPILPRQQPLVFMDALNSADEIKSAQLETNSDAVNAETKWYQREVRACQGMLCAMTSKADMEMDLTLTAIGYKTKVHEAAGSFSRTSSSSSGRISAVISLSNILKI